MELKAGRRKIRIRQKFDLEGHLFQLIENTLDEVSSLLKNNDFQKIEKKLLDKFYDFVSKLVEIILEFCNDYYVSTNDKPLKVGEELLYHEDGKTIEERLKDIYTRFPKEEQVLIRKHSFGVILITEGQYIINTVIRKKVNIAYVEIIGEGGDCDICAEYLDGNLYREDEIELPPYHPNCLCEAVFYEDTDVIGDI